MLNIFSFTLYKEFIYYKKLECIFIHMNTISINKYYY